MESVIRYIGHLLPERQRDPTLQKLHGKFGRNPFSLFEASDALAIDYTEAFEIPSLIDSCLAVTRTGGRFCLTPRDHSDVALPHWKAKYLPVLKRMPETFTAETFSYEAHIPYQTANFILSLFLRNGLIVQNIANLAITASSYQIAPKKVVWLTKKRRVIRCG